MRVANFSGMVWKESQPFTSRVEKNASLCKTKSTGKSHKYKTKSNYFKYYGELIQIPREKNNEH